MIMKFSSLLIVSILIMGFFGFANMNHEIGSATGCITSVADNIPCPEDIIAMSIHHIQAFITFFSVIPTAPLIILMALLFTVFLRIGYIFIKLRKSVLPNVLWWSRPDPERQLICPRKITSWLSLFENSPSLHKIFITISNHINLCKQKISKITKTTSSSTLLLSSILSAGWSLMQTASKFPRIPKARHTTSAPFTARITLQLIP